MALKIGGLPG